MKITLDAGHGPDTPGKRSPDGSLREYQFNAATAAYMATLLRRYDNVDVMFTHTDSRDVPLAERTYKANAWGASLFVSIHANAAGGEGWQSARGIETYVHTSRPAGALAIANAMQRHLVAATGLLNRGVKAADFHVLRETSMTAVLVECGFMTHMEEAQLLKADSYRQQCAAAMVTAIAEVYQLRLKAGNDPTDAPVPKADDVAGHWAETELRKAVAAGILRGMPDGTLKPDQPLTRAELAVVLQRLKLI